MQRQQLTLLLCVNMQMRCCTHSTLMSGSPSKVQTFPRFRGLQPNAVLSSRLAIHSHGFISNLTQFLFLPTIWCAVGIYFMVHVFYATVLHLCISPFSVPFLQVALGFIC